MNMITLEARKLIGGMGAVLVGVLGLMGCGGGAGEEGLTRTSGAALEAASNAVPMLVYSTKGKVDQSGFVSLGSPAGLGGRVLAGNPAIFARVDFQQGNIAGGLFKATEGVVEVTFPFTEHATILEGEVKITDATGKTFTYKEGDSYIIQQGQVVRWEVKDKYVIKSFFNIVESR